MTFADRDGTFNYFTEIIQTQKGKHQVLFQWQILDFRVLFFMLM